MTNSHTPARYVYVTCLFFLYKFLCIQISCNSIFVNSTQGNIIMLTPDTQIDLDTWHHIRVKGTLCQIGGGVLLQAVNKSGLTICIQVSEMW
jgi:hypothetical protein